MNFDHCESYIMVMSNKHSSKVTIFWSSIYDILFFGKACKPKNNLLDQNCLRTVMNNTSAIYCFQGWWIYALAIQLDFAQVDAEVTIFGLHSYLIGVDLASFISDWCSNGSYLRNRCNFLFWVWVKPEGHHLGYIYIESCFIFFSSSLLSKNSIWLDYR
jgi:hypothetical protein